MRIVRAPSVALLGVADALEVAVRQFIDARGQGEASGEWEAPVHAWTMSNVMCRNIEAVTVLAHTDEVLVTAAWSNARAAFDIAVRIVWLLYPGDRIEREVRWLAILREFERFQEYLAEHLVGVSASSENPTIAATVQSFREAVTSRLPNGYQVPAKVPDFKTMLTEIGTAEMHALYRLASQYPHGTMFGTGQYWRNLGTRKELGELVRTLDWVLPLRLCWLSLRQAGDFVIDRLYANPLQPNWEALEESVSAAFGALDKGGNE